MESLSLAQAQKIVLLSQKLPPKKKRNGGALASTLSAIENLGYVQIDTISVIQRAHHHTLWNRNYAFWPWQLLDESLANALTFIVASKPLVTQPTLVDLITLVI